MECASSKQCPSIPVRRSSNQARSVVDQLKDLRDAVYVNINATSSANSTEQALRGNSGPRKPSKKILELVELWKWQAYGSFLDDNRSVRLG